MNTTNKQDETLGKIIYEFYPEILHDYVSSAERSAFANGANWQKEQDKVVIDKLIEALEKTNTEYNHSLKLIAEVAGVNYSENNFSISNKQLLNSLK